MKACRKCGNVTDDYSPDKRASDGLQSRCRPCCRKANRDRRNSDLDAARARERAYVAKNWERVRATNAASRKRNRESLLERKREYYRRVKESPAYIAKVAEYQERNKEKKRQYDRAYRASRREKDLERAREWKKRNPEKRAAIVRTYSAKRRAQEEAGISGGALAAWTRTQPKVCFYCEADCADDFHVDHFIPLAKGGAHVLTNLRIACPPCNLRKNAKFPDEWIEEIAEVAA